MPTNQRTRRRWFWLLSLFVVAIALPLGAFAWVDYQLALLSDRLDASAREDVRSQVANVKARQSAMINLTNEMGKGALDEFALVAAELEGKRFAIAVSYSSGVDSFLEQIRGLAGLYELTIYKSHVSDAGLKQLATLPDLESLQLSDARITDAGIKQLESCPRLAELKFSPRQPVTITVAAVAALSRLRKLTLYDTYPDSWLEPGLEDLGRAQNLKELTLVYINEEKVAPLRARLPNCTITVNEKGK